MENKDTTAKTNKDSGIFITKVIVEGEPNLNGNISFFKITVKAENGNICSEISRIVMACSRSEAVRQNEALIKCMSNVAVESVEQIIMRMGYTYGN